MVICNRLFDQQVIETIGLSHREEEFFWLRWTQSSQRALFIQET